MDKVMLLSHCTFPQKVLDIFEGERLPLADNEAIRWSIDASDKIYFSCITRKKLKEDLFYFPGPVCLLFCPMILKGREWFTNVRDGPTKGEMCSPMNILVHEGEPPMDVYRYLIAIVTSKWELYVLLNNILPEKYRSRLIYVRYPGLGEEWEEPTSIEKMLSPSYPLPKEGTIPKLSALFKSVIQRDLDRIGESGMKKLAKHLLEHYDWEGKRDLARGVYREIYLQG